MPIPVVVAPLAVALGGSLAYAHVRAARRAGLTVSRHTMPWSVARRVRVVHLTDLHVGPTTPARVLRRVVDVVTGLDADLVVMTGDYVNTSARRLGPLTDFVHALPKPCIAVLGNHDHWTDPVRIAGALARGGAVVLQNAVHHVEGRGFDLPVVGVDDGRSRHADVRRAFRQVATPERALVLTHDPRTAEEIAGHGAPLVLSGHTHGGQIDVPHVVPFFARLAGMPYLRGFHRIARTDLYVSAGLGHARSGLRSPRTAPEIAVFDLDPRARRRTSERCSTPLGAPRR